MELDIVLPVHNEKLNLYPLYEEIEEVLTPVVEDYRVLFVDDGSTDGSSHALRELAREQPRAESVHFREKSGQSAAFAAGFERAEAPVVVTMDADGQNDPADIPRLLEHLPDCDMVAGYRSDREDSLLRTLASRVANRFRNWVTGDNIIDTGCSLKVYRQEVVRDLPMFEGMHRFLPTLARMKGYSVTQVPTRHRPRKRGTSKYTLSGRFLTTLVDLFAVRWMLSRSLGYTIEEVHEARELESQRKR